LQRAIKIHEQIDFLEIELREALGGEENPMQGRRITSASARRKIAAAQRLRWAKSKIAIDGPSIKQKRRKMSRATKAKIAAAAKARWAKVHAAGKNRL
jgi:hypothetical protein